MKQKKKDFFWNEKPPPLSYATHSYGIKARYGVRAKGMG